MNTGDAQLLGVRPGYLNSCAFKSRLKVPIAWKRKKNNKKRTGAFRILKGIRLAWRHSFPSTLKIGVVVWPDVSFRYCVTLTFAERNRLLLRLVETSR